MGQFSLQKHIVGVLFLCAIILGGAYLMFFPTTSSPESIVEPMATIPVGPRVLIHRTTISVEVATTSAAIQKGLSGRPSLDPEKGMLFIFTTPGRYNFWMPDMHFPIDILWIQDEVVRGIEAHVSNIFDPENPRFYTPPIPIQYVLEVNAGFTEAHKIRVGDSVMFYDM